MAANGTDEGGVQSVGEPSAAGDGYPELEPDLACLVENPSPTVSQPFGQSELMVTVEGGVEITAFPSELLL